MKKYISTFVILIMVIMATFKVEAHASSLNIDESNLNNGMISVSYQPKKNIQTKVMVQKENIKYTYTLQGNDKFPLQLGNGDYQIRILEQVKGTTYRQIDQQVVSLDMSNSNSVYLQSSQIINWTSNMKAIKQAKKLTKGAKTDKEKLNAIYQYIIKNIKYDKIKIKSVQGTSYVPSIEDTYKSSKGLCYDYSAIMAAMLRSVGVPTKLVMGYSDKIDVYHAWNEVYLEDVGSWVTIDTTYDVAAKDAKISYKMIKNASEFSVEKTY